MWRAQAIFSPSFPGKLAGQKTLAFDVNQLRGVSHLPWRILRAPAMLACATRIGIQDDRADTVEVLSGSPCNRLFCCVTGPVFTGPLTQRFARITGPLTQLIGQKTGSVAQLRGTSATRDRACLCGFFDASISSYKLSIVTNQYTQTGGRSRDVRALSSD